jgi:1-phosphofructokinase family hexose kinase
MIVTVTANTSMDQTLFLSSFKKNTTMRALNVVQSMGGKPTDAALILGELGIPSLALGFAAGYIGTKIETMLHAKGVTTDFIPVGGESRLITVIVDQSDHTQTTITPSTLEVKPEHVAQLRERFLRVLGDATCVITGGTLPAGMNPSFYADLICLARERNVPVIFDAGEPNLSAGLAAGPTVIKPNRDELSALVGHPIESVEAAYQAAQNILEQHGTSVIVTLGKDGGLAVLPDRAYRVPSLQVEVVSAAGAGDAVLAGLAASLERRQPVEEGLRLGFAAAAAVLLLPGTADCHRSDVERFLPQIELIPYP